MQPKLSAEAFQARITSLLAKLEDEGNLNDASMISVIENCYMGATGVFEALYGGNSVQVKALQDAKKSVPGMTPSNQRILLALKIKGALQNLEQEIELGLVNTLAKQTAGEVFGDLLAVAKSARQEGHTSVAAVLAVAALEDGLKRIATLRGISTQGKTMDATINALKSDSFFRGAQGAIVGSYVKLRNFAMHAEWDKIQDADVGSLIGFLESFLIENFS